MPECSRTQRDPRWRQRLVPECPEEARRLPVADQLLRQNGAQDSVVLPTPKQHSMLGSRHTCLSRESTSSHISPGKESRSTRPTTKAGRLLQASEASASRRFSANFFLRISRSPLRRFRQNSRPQFVGAVSAMMHVENKWVHESRKSAGPTSEDSAKAKQPGVTKTPTIGIPVTPGYLRTRCQAPLGNALPGSSCFPSGSMVFLATGAAFTQTRLKTHFRGAKGDHWSEVQPRRTLQRQNQLQCSHDFRVAEPF